LGRPPPPPLGGAPLPPTARRPGPPGGGGGGDRRGGRGRKQRKYIAGLGLGARVSCKQPGRAAGPPPGALGRTALGDCRRGRRSACPATAAVIRKGNTYMQAGRQGGSWSLLLGNHHPRVAVERRGAAAAGEDVAGREHVRVPERTPHTKPRGLRYTGSAERARGGGGVGTAWLIGASERGPTRWTRPTKRTRWS
jgi:hypothetical protein